MRKMLLCRRGFTLIEQLIVLAILLIIAAIVLPNFRGAQQSALLTNTAREMVVNIRLANQRAVTEQIEYSVEFDIPNKSYRIVKESDPPVVEKEVFLDSVISYQSVTIPGGKVTFNSAGAPSETGTVSLTHNVTAEVETVEITPSGFVKIQ